VSHSESAMAPVEDTGHSPTAIPWFKVVSVGPGSRNPSRFDHRRYRLTPVGFTGAMRRGNDKELGVDRGRRSACLS
jgi:hypothetical protein